MLAMFDTDTPVDRLDAARAAIAEARARGLGERAVDRIAARFGVTWGIGFAGGLQVTDGGGGTGALF